MGGGFFECFLWEGGVLWGRCWRLCGVVGKFGWCGLWGSGREC